MVNRSRQAACLAFIWVVSANSFAELIIEGRISAGLSSNASELSLASTPSFSVGYENRFINLQSEFSTSFNSQQEQYWTGQWQSNNQLGWVTSSQRFGGNLAYVHAESESESNLLANDAVDAVIALSVPISRITSHQISLSGGYQQLVNVDSNSSLSDYNGSVTYGLQWQPVRAQIWQADATLRRYYSGSSIQSTQVTWQLNGELINWSLVANVNKTEQGEQQVWFYGGQFGVFYRSDGWIADVRMERSLTDSLSHYEFIFLSDPIEEQQQVLVESIAVNVSEITTIVGVLNAYFQVGQTESVFKVDAFNIETSDSTKYREAGAELTTPLSEESGLRLSLNTRRDETLERLSGSVNYSRRFDSHWAMSARFSQIFDLQNQYSWFLGLDYSL